MVPRTVTNENAINGKLETVTEIIFKRVSLTDPSIYKICYNANAPLNDSDATVELPQIWSPVSSDVVRPQITGFRISDQLAEDAW